VESHSAGREWKRDRKFKYGTVQGAVRSFDDVRASSE
jgi:hypothetical protein